MDVRQHFISIKKSQLHVVATLLDPRLEMGFFHEEKLIRQSYCWFSWLQQDEPKHLKTKAKKGKNLLWKDHMEKPLTENFKKQTVVLPRLNTSRFWMMEAVALPTIHLSQKIHMSKQNWWRPRTWMSQSVNTTFVHYRCRWDSATDIQKLQQ